MTLNLEKANDYSFFVKFPTIANKVGNNSHEAFLLLRSPTISCKTHPFTLFFQKKFYLDLSSKKWEQHPQCYRQKLLKPRLSPNSNGRSSSIIIAAKELLITSYAQISKNAHYHYY
jgi:hypothetical protein